MADETITETVEQVPVEPEKQEPEKVEPKKSIEELIVENETLKRTVFNKDEEAKRVHNKLAKFEEEEKKRKEAELSEIEKANLRAEKAEKDAAELKLNLNRREIAAKLGLPEILIDRIKGETPEDMEADAKKLIDELPKPQKANISTTNPSSGSQQGETKEQRMERLR